MATAALTRYTPEEYLALQRNAELRYSSVDDLDGSLVLASLGLEIPLRRIYAKALRPADAESDGTDV